MSHVTSSLKRLSSMLALTLLMGLFTALMPSRSLATQPPAVQIFIYETGGPTNETISYSYSENHLIFLSTMQVVGYPSASGLTTVTDDSNNVIGYRLDIVDTNDDVIGYLLYPA